MTNSSHQFHGLTWGKKTVLLKINFFRDFFFFSVVNAFIQGFSKFNSNLKITEELLFFIVIVTVPVLVNAETSRNSPIRLV